MPWIYPIKPPATGSTRTSRHHRGSAATPVPVRLHDLAGQRQSQAGAIALGRIEGHQRVLQHLLVHALAAIQHIQAQPLRQPRQLHPHVIIGRIGFGAGFVGVLQQVQQRLPELRDVDAAAQFLFRLLLQGERDLLAQAGQEGRPVHGLQLWLGQLGKARIATDEALQVARPVLDGGEDLRQPFETLPLHQHAAGMGQRGDRCQRIVELVADHPDHLFHVCTSWRRSSAVSRRTSSRS